MNIKKLKINFFVIAGLIFFLDQITKAWVRARVPLYSEISVLPFFNIVHVSNTGMAFGLFQGKNWPLAILGAGMIIFIVVYAFRLIPHDLLSAYLLALVLGGAMGNVTDRLMRGEVTDFLDFFVGSYHWPSFNVADSAICVGAIALMLASFRGKNVSSHL